MRIKFHGEAYEQLTPKQEMCIKIDGLYEEFVSRCNATEDKNAIEIYRKNYISSLKILLEKMDLGVSEQLCDEARQTEEKINKYAISRVMSLHNSKSKKQIWQQFGNTN